MKHLLDVAGAENRVEVVTVGLMVRRRYFVKQGNLLSPIPFLGRALRGQGRLRFERTRLPFTLVVTPFGTPRVSLDVFTYFIFSPNIDYQLKFLLNKQTILFIEVVGSIYEFFSLGRIFSLVNGPINSFQFYL